MVSVRTPVRPGPASLPSNRTFTRSPSPNGSGCVVVVVGARVVVVGPGGTVVVPVVPGIVVVTTASVVVTCPGSAE